MTINELLSLIFALIGGAGVGFIFFGGLWVTVQKLPTSSSPGLLVLGSFVGRTGITILFFLLIMDGSWQRLLACLVGFILMRQLFIRQLRPTTPIITPVNQT